MKLFAIPDIHGRLDLLNPLLEKLFTEEKLDLTVDKLIFLGDMIDRGDDSRGVLARVRSLVEAHPSNVVALAGNHEWLAIDGCLDKKLHSFDLWMANGGGETMRSYPNGRVSDDDVRWMASLPLKHEEPGFFFSHAPVPIEDERRNWNKGQPEFDRDELIWTYDPDEEYIARDHGNGVVGVCGHIHALRKKVFSPRFYDHYIYADAGSGCHDLAALVAIEVQERKVVYMWPEEPQI